jgi:predicted metallopeptidase
MSKRNRKGNLIWKEAPDIKRRISKLSIKLNLGWIIRSRIFCYRSNNSSSRAYARIWGLAKVWQKALNQKPAYIIEVLSEKFDKLSPYDQDKVLLHEITHIPKNFSGSLLPHIRRGKRNFEGKVLDLMRTYFKNKNTFGK